MAAKIPPKLSAGQVIAKVESLWTSGPMTAYRNVFPVYRALVFMRLENQVPDSYARGLRVSMPTTRVIRTMRILKADTAGYPRYTDAMARSPKTGVPTRALQTKADSLGRKLTMMNALLDDNRQVTDPSRDGQLALGYTVWILHRRKAPGDGFSWEIEVAAPDTCAFPEQTGGVYQPKTMARKYRQYVRWLNGVYGDKGRNRGQQLAVKEGAVSWVPLSPARALENSDGQNGITGVSSDYDQEIDVKYYDDGCYIYHVACNPKGSDGVILYCERNTTYEQPDDPSSEPEYAAQAVVIAGDSFSIGGDGEKMLPVLMALLNIANARNLIREIRGIAALRDKPDMVVTADVTPQELEQLKALGAVVPAEDEDGGSALVYAAGNRAQPWQVVANQDLDKIAIELKQEEDECVSEMLVNTSPDVVTGSTAAAYYTSTGATQRQKTNWLQNLDGGWVLADRMICNGAKNEDEAYAFVAKDTYTLSSGDSIAQGELADLEPDDVDFPFDISVATKEETEEQKSKRLLNALYLEDRGVRTHDQVLEEDTADVVRRNKELAVDAGRKIVQPVLIDQYLPQMIQQRVLLRAGYWMPLVPGAFSGQQPGGAPGGAGGGGGDNPPPGGANYTPAPIEAAGGGAGATQ